MVVAGAGACVHRLVVGILLSVLTTGPGVGAAALAVVALLPAEGRRLEHRPLLMAMLALIIRLGWTATDPFAPMFMIGLLGLQTWVLVPIDHRASVLVRECEKAAKKQSHLRRKIFDCRACLVQVIAQDLGTRWVA